MSMAEPDGHDGVDRLDLEGLRVGQRFTSREHALDAARIEAFAGRFDPQPFHLDEEAARSSLFAGPAASGRHTAALTMRLLVEGGERRVERRSRAASSARARRSPGRGRRGRATSSG
jgi:acyl dehydratase